MNFVLWELLVKKYSSLHGLLVETETGRDRENPTMELPCVSLSRQRSTFEKSVIKPVTVYLRVY